MERILLIMKANTPEECCVALQSAFENAAKKKRVSYGLLTPVEPVEETSVFLRQFGSVRYQSAGGRISEAVCTLWQGEDHVLVIDPQVSFCRGWDAQLLSALNACSGSEKHCALTGILPDPTDAVDAVYPIAADHMDDQDSLVLRKGLPLLYAVKPLRTLFMNPCFCFAPYGFWRDLSQVEGDNALWARRKGWIMFTAHRAVIRSTVEKMLPILTASEWREPDLPDAEGLLVKGELSVSARTGIPSNDGSFERRVPVPERLQYMMRAAARGKDEPQPLLVTRFGAEKAADGTDAAQDLVYFRLLSSVKTMPLLCFAQPSTISRLRKLHANTLEYKPRYRLQLGYIPEKEDEKLLPDLSKMVLINIAREKQLNHTHYIWVDRGILHYPVYQGIVPEWHQICTEKVLLATVDGEPDVSMIVVPQRHLAQIAQEFEKRCREKLHQARKLPTETEIWKALLEERPDLVEGIPLPRIGMLIDLPVGGRSEELYDDAEERAEQKR